MTGPNYLNDIEKDAIQQFLENPTMKEAVKKVLLAGIYFNGTLRPGEPAEPTKNFAIAVVSHGLAQGVSDELLGQDLRGRTIGIGLLVDAFENLESLKKVKAPETTKVNPAR